MHFQIREKHQASLVMGREEKKKTLAAGGAKFGRRPERGRGPARAPSRNFAPKAGSPSKYYFPGDSTNGSEIRR